MASSLALTRFFSADKTITSPAMNRLGAQVARTVLARVMHNMRGAHVDSTVRDQVEALQHDGLVTIPNFLSPADFDEVRAKTEELWEREQANLKTINFGPNTSYILGQDKVPLATELGKFYGDPRLPAILEAVERRPNTFKHRAHRAVERLKQGGPPEAEDPETNLHSDIFFTTHKAWLYLTDVTPECGPLVFVKRSHLLSRKLLSYVYRESCGANTGSRRITKQELQDLGLEETVLTAPRNTLAVANTFGFHRRVRGVPGNERLALHVSLRTNPFFSRR